MANLPTSLTSHFVNSHLVNVDKVGIDKVGIDEVGINLNHMPGPYITFSILGGQCH